MRVSCRSPRPTTTQDRLASVRRARRTRTRDAGDLRVQDGRVRHHDLRLRRARRAHPRARCPAASMIDYVIDAAGAASGVKRNGVRRARLPLRAGSARSPSSTPTARCAAASSTPPSSNVPGPDGAGREDLPDHHRPGRARPRAVVDTANGTVVQRARLRRVRPRDAEVGAGLPAVRLRRRAAATATPASCASAPVTTTRRRAASRRQDPLRFGGGDTNLYGYALNDPVNLTDPTGQILDTILDVGFIAYDAVRHRAVADERVRAVRGNAAAFGADVAAILSRASPAAARRCAASRRPEGPRRPLGRRPGRGQGRAHARRP